MASKHAIILHYMFIFISLVFAFIDKTAMYGALGISWFFAGVSLICQAIEGKE